MAPRDLDSRPTSASPAKFPTAATLKSARLGKGWTQRDVAEALGVTGSKVSRWETGSAPIPSEFHAALERLLDLGSVSNLGEDARTFRGRPRSSWRTASRPFGPRAGNKTEIHTRVDLVENLSFLFQISHDDCELLVKLAIDEGPLTLRACLETSLVALAAIAQQVVVKPKQAASIYPVYLEYSGYPTPLRSVSNQGRDVGVHQTHSTNPEPLPLGIPMQVPDQIMQFSYANNRLAVPAVTGPNHERAAFVLIANLAFQIQRAQEDRD